MSRSKNDRIFQSKSGKTFHNNSEELDHEGGFVLMIAKALRQDFGSGSGAVKRVARLRDFNERAVRNWFEGRNGPSGEHLVMLMQRSDAVLEAVLELAGRRQLLARMKISKAQDQIRQVLAIIETLGLENVD